MLADDVFYKIFRDEVLGIQHHDVDEKKEGEQEEPIQGNDENHGNDVAANNLNADDNDEEVNETKSERVSFLVHQVDIVPQKVRDIYCNMMRSYPSSPLFLYLAVGCLGTNIARYSAVRRLSAHPRNVIRTGCFYMFLAPSRFGKGIVMNNGRVGRSC